MAIKNSAAIGQAINLAAADARQNNRECDTIYIYKRYVIWSAICEAIQSSDVEEIQSVINCKTFDDFMKKFKEYLDKESK